MNGYQVRVYAIHNEEEKSQFFRRQEDAVKHFEDLVSNPTWDPAEGDHVVILKIVEFHEWRK